jgi:hypothetical protein
MSAFRRFYYLLRGLAHPLNPVYGMQLDDDKPWRVDTRGLTTLKISPWGTLAGLPKRGVGPIPIHLGILGSFQAFGLLKKVQSDFLFFLPSSVRRASKLYAFLIL